MSIYLRKAKPNEAEILTKVSMDGKRHWNYPEHYYEIWREELTITSKYIEDNIVYVAAENGRIVGFFSIMKEIRNDKSEINWLDNLFIKKSHIGRGVGKELIEFALYLCNINKIKSLYIVSEPLAKGFYEKFGGVYVGEHKSSTINGRTLPIYVIKEH